MKNFVWFLAATAVFSCQKPEQIETAPNHFFIAENFTSTLISGFYDFDTGNIFVFDNLQEDERGPKMQVKIIDNSSIKFQSNYYKFSPETPAVFWTHSVCEFNTNESRTSTFKMSFCNDGSYYMLAHIEDDFLKSSRRNSDGFYFVLPMAF